MGSNLKSVAIFLLVGLCRRDHQVCEQLIHFSCVFGSVVDIKLQVRNDPQLMTDTFGKLLADETGIFPDRFQQHSFVFIRQETEVCPGNAQVGRYAHGGDRHKRAVGKVLRIFLKNLSQVFLYLPAYFLLSFRFHVLNVKWRGLAGPDRTSWFAS